MQLEQKYRQISINIDNNRHLFKKNPNISHKHTGACLATANDQSDRSNNRHALHREEHLDFPWPAWVLDVVVIIVWSCRHHSGSVKGGRGEERDPHTQPSIRVESNHQFPQKNTQNQRSKVIPSTVHGRQVEWPCTLGIIWTMAGRRRDLSVWISSAWIKTTTDQTQTRQIATRRTHVKRSTTKCVGGMDGCGASNVSSCWVIQFFWTRQLRRGPDRRRMLRLDGGFRRRGRLFLSIFIDNYRHGISISINIDIHTDINQQYR